MISNFKNVSSKFSENTGIFVLNMLFGQKYFKIEKPKNSFTSFTTESTNVCSYLLS